MECHDQFFKYRHQTFCGIAHRCCATLEPGSSINGADLRFLKRFFELFKKQNHTFTPSYASLKAVIKFKISHVKCQMEHDTYQVSSVKCQLPSVRCQLSVVKIQMLHAQCQMTAVKSQMKHDKCRVSVFKCQVPSVPST